MPTIPCTATVRDIANATTINVRSGPGTHTAILTTLPTGASGLIVLDVQPDELLANAGGKVYQWFQLRLPDGATGWVRDDLLDIHGECASFGYKALPSPTPAFSLTRVPRPPTPEQERVRKAAFNITASFEGGSYDSYQNHDTGIISYGRFQFTLQSGSLFSVVDKFVEAAPDHPLAEKLRDHYLERLQKRDWSLRDDDTLRELLVKAAAEEAMQRAQDQVAHDVYWRRIYDLSIAPRGIVTPLGQAFLFDTGLHHGIFHNLLSLAETAFNVPPRSRLGHNGVSERDFIRQVALLRRDRLALLAQYRGLNGLKRRGDFWVDLVETGDWALRGDARGEVETYPGRRVAVRTP
ncbi:MAG: chitosanase [Chloroflexota bacterium]